MLLGPPLIVVTGPSGAGKSTLCRLVVAAARARGLDVTGVTTERRTDNGHPAGLDVTNVATGERCPLAEWDAWTDGPTTGRWHFHQATFDTGLEWCRRRIAPGALLVVDELGPLELLENLGWAPLIPRLWTHDGPLLVVVRPTLVERFTPLVDQRETFTVRLDPGDRGEAVKRVLGHLGFTA